MNKVSERRRLEETMSPNVREAKEPDWVIIGAGRLGRGFLNVVADELSFRSLLVVAGENTPQTQVDVFNELRDRGEGYRVLSSQTGRPIQLLNYQFTTSVDTWATVEAIQAPATRVVSTSVGLDRIGQIAPIVARGLSLRRCPPADPILLLVCENGRSPDGLPPSEAFRRALERYLPSHDLAKLVVLPRVVVDCAVPTLPTPQGTIRISDGTLWTESLPEAQAVLGGSKRVTLLDADTIGVVHTSKLYGYNTLHCLLSVLGSYYGEACVDMVGRSPYLQEPLRAIVEDVAAAVGARHHCATSRAIGRETILGFCEGSLARLRKPVADEFDLVERGLRKTLNGWYFADGRIEGPILDLGLLDEPWKSPQLVHALSLCLYRYMENIDALRESMPWLSRRRTPRLPGFLVQAPINVIASSPQSAVAVSHTRRPLMEVLAEDTRELDRWTGDHWTAERLAAFLTRPIDHQIRVVPRDVGIPKCVVFSLNGGVVSTESLLYLATRDLIAKYSRAGRNISHDQYAAFVGVSERGFFEEIVREFQIRARTADALVLERERLYLKMLEKCPPDSLMKPGLRDTLRLLAKHGVKMAVCSNASSTRVQATLEHVGLVNYFSLTESPGGILREKPAPDMLEAIMSELNVEREACVVVTPSTTTAEAARRAGCFCVMVVNEYTTPGVLPRRGVQMLSNAQELHVWFEGVLAQR